MVGHKKKPEPSNRLWTGASLAAPRAASSSGPWTRWESAAT
jgi:hypothetical protein